MFNRTPYTLPGYRGNGSPALDDAVFIYKSDSTQTYDLVAYQYPDLGISLPVAVKASAQVVSTNPFEYTATARQLVSVLALIECVDDTANGIENYLAAVRLNYTDVAVSKSAVPKHKNFTDVLQFQIVADVYIRQGETLTLALRAHNTTGLQSELVIREAVFVCVRHSNYNSLINLL